MMVLLLAACGGDEVVPPSEGGAAKDYAGPVGRITEFVPFGDPTAEPVTLAILAGSWEVEDTEDAVTAYTTHVDDDGFTVDGQALLPGRLAAGATAEGVEVTASGETETWYGTFPDTVTVLVEGGPFVGSQVFARDVGPVLITWNGWSGELAYYE